jgi:CheY-like chemotaxis protein
MPNSILIAEDFENDALLLQQVLKGAGVSNPIFTLSDGDEVLAYFKGEGRFSDRDKFPLPSVLLLDLKMARVGGYEVLQWLQTHPEFKPLIVIVTGIEETKEIQRAYLLGAHSFITKPCNPEDIHKMRKAFGHYWESFSPN